MNNQHSINSRAANGRADARKSGFSFTSSKLERRLHCGSLFERDYGFFLDFNPNVATFHYLPFSFMPASWDELNGKVNGTGEAAANEEEFLQIHYWAEMTDGESNLIHLEPRGFRRTGLRNYLYEEIAVALSSSFSFCVINEQQAERTVLFKNLRFLTNFAEQETHIGHAELLRHLYEKRDCYTLEVLAGHFLAAAYHPGIIFGLLAQKLLRCELAAEKLHAKTEVYLGYIETCFGDF